MLLSLEVEYEETEEVQEVSSEPRRFMLERAGGTRVYLTIQELKQRWEDDNCSASDRIIDQRTGRQFPAATLKVLFAITKTGHHLDSLV